MSRKPDGPRLRPSLLDCFSDAAEGGPASMSPGDLKRALVRDISTLLNASGLEQVVDLSDYPYVANSTLNFGSPALDGQHREGLDLYHVQEGVARSLHRFEPRLMPDTLRVTSADDPGQGAIVLRIEGEIRADPAPLRVVMRTEVEAEMPAIRVVECRDEGFA
ncbi:type VI secretion system baseplate subunit TssE [Falsirhodobacter sp. 20TX0035]|uniref:type VI secretion system baseplate subunit TssE n=1 Tax=Falsirhodobacter sp. 20TX0035 TaxID=3022019 RepID=UPI00232B1361|nr:GPW/gp25 family protein [Falsirhodobacter sp. 20TX0035]MDB6453062.1 GPW/gp25 family protein [Falsirhodobacter sp. 20TX0035]